MRLQPQTKGDRPVKQHSEKQNSLPELGLPARIGFFAAATALALFSASDTGLGGMAASVVSAALILVLALTSGSAVDTAAAFLPGLAVYIFRSLVFADRSDGLAMAFISSVSVLFILVIAFGLWSTVKLGQSRAASIAVTAALCVVFWLFCMALRVRSLTGRVDIETIRAVLDAFFEPFRNMLSSITFEQGGSTLRLYSDTAIDSMINTAKRTFIGSFGAAMLVVVYLSTVCARIISAIFGVFSVFPTAEHDEIAIMPTDEKNDRVGIFIEHIRFPWRIEISSVSAVVAVIAYVVCILFSDPDKQLTAVTVAENLMILLMPGLIYVGVRALAYGLSGNSRGLFGLRAKRNSFGTIAIIIAATALFFVSPAAPLTLLALNGVIDIFSENFRRASASHASHIDSDADDRKE